jgi:hypothetical protein
LIMRMNCFRILQSTCVGFVLVLIVCAVACLPSGNVAPPQSDAPVVAPAPPAAPVQDASKLPALQQNQRVIFQDDFKNPGSGWNVFTNDFGEGNYGEGGYYLKCTRPSSPEFKVFTINPSLTSLTGCMIDMDLTMMSGSRDDRVGILLKWPDINPMGIPGYEQPSDYYFLLFPYDQSVTCYSKHQIKGSSADLEPGYFLRRAPYTCVNGINSVNNIKIWFNPGVFFTINGYKLVNVSSDPNLDFANRLIRDGAMTGATLQIVANSEDVYSRPVFQLNKITVANME